MTISIDVKKNWLGRYSVYSHSGTIKTKLDPVEWAVKVQDLGAGEILVNSIDRDGTCIGYDNEIIKAICKAVTVPVIACGGAQDYRELETVIADTGASAAAAGRLFVFHGEHDAVLINYPERGQESVNSNPVI